MDHDLKDRTSPAERLDVETPSQAREKQAATSRRFPASNNTNRRTILMILTSDGANGSCSRPNDTSQPRHGSVKAGGPALLSGPRAFPLLAGWRLPQFDLVALGIDNPAKFAANN